MSAKQPQPQPFVVRAKVVRLATADGLVACGEHVKVGDVFFVDLNTAHDVGLINVDQKVPHVKRVVQEVVQGGWLLHECLEVLA